jgi:hypothetical protein
MSNKKLFQPGNDGHGGGRPPGSRGRLTSKFIEALCSDFEEHGIGAIRVCRVEKPDVYIRCIASIIPKELAIADAKLGDLGDEEIASLLATVRELKSRAAEESAEHEQLH